MRFHALLMVLVFPTLIYAQQPKLQPPAVVVEVLTDRPEALYKCGEEVTFKIRLLKDKKAVTEGEVNYNLSLDGHKTIKAGKLKLGAEAVTVTGTLAEPGFLRCTVTMPVDKTNVTGSAGAGFDPLKIKPSLPVPDDFDKFWDDQKKKLAAVPINPKLTPVTSTNVGVDAFDLQADCIGAPVSGYFAKPKEAKPKSLPAVLYVHGAGVRSSSLGAAIGGASQQMLALDINAHGIPNGKPDTFYTDLTNKELKDYRAIGRNSRDTIYFLGMYLRLIRAIDFLTSQPEWDGKVVIVRGGSQGGGQSIAAAGLDSRVTFISAGVPAICDHSGNVVDRVAGWPKIVPMIEGKPDPKVLEAARYIDCMNLATRSKAEAIISVGFIDGVCPPTGIYATYNNLPGKKQIVNDVLLGHSVSQKFNEETNKLIKAHIEKMHGK